MCPYTNIKNIKQAIRNLENIIADPNSRGEEVKNAKTWIEYYKQQLKEKKKNGRF